MFYQFRVDFCQALPFFEHYIGCILPLIQHPIISLRKYLFYSGQNGIYLPGKCIKCLRKIDVNKPLRYLLRPLHIINLNNTIIVSLIPYALAIQPFTQPFTSVDINLYLKRKPRLYPYMHETKFLMLVIKYRNKHLRSRITTSNFPVSLLPRVSNDTHGSTIVMTQISPSFIPSSSCIFRATSSFLILLESSGINGRPSLPDSSRALSLISPDTFFAYLPKSLNNTFS